MRTDIGVISVKCLLFIILFITHVRSIIKRTYQNELLCNLCLYICNAIMKT